MITKEIIDRINELYNKDKSMGLTPEEKEEQQKLRRIYIDSFKENLRSQLKSIKVVSPDEYDRMSKEKECGCEEHHHDHDEHLNCGCKNHKN